MLKASHPHLLLTNHVYAYTCLFHVFIPTNASTVRTVGGGRCGDVRGVQDPRHALRLLLCMPCLLVPVPVSLARCVYTNTHHTYDAALTHYSVKNLVTKPILLKYAFPGNQGTNGQQACKKAPKSGQLPASTSTALQVASEAGSTAAHCCAGKQRLTLSAPQFNTQQHSRQ